MINSVRPALLKTINDYYLKLIIYKQTATACAKKYDYNFNSSKQRIRKNSVELYEIRCVYFLFRFVHIQDIVRSEPHFKRILQ